MAVYLYNWVGIVNIANSRKGAMGFRRSAYIFKWEKMTVGWTDAFTEYSKDDTTLCDS